MVPAVTVNCAWHSTQRSTASRLTTRAISFFPHFGQTGPEGQRSFSKYSRHLPSQLNCAIRSGSPTRGRIVVTVMGHAPMKKKKRQKSDRQVLKELFPPEIVREVDATLE